MCAPPVGVSGGSFDGVAGATFADGCATYVCAGDATFVDGCPTHVCAGDATSVDVCVPQAFRGGGIRTDRIAGR